MDGSYLMSKRVVLAIAAVAVLLLVLFAGVKAEIIRPNMVFAPEGVKGVGISEHQGAIDLKTLSNDGVEFVYAKATEGSSHVDSQFAATCGRASGCRAALGAYHFSSIRTTTYTIAICGGISTNTNYGFHAANGPPGSNGRKGAESSGSTAT